LQEKVGQNLASLSDRLASVKGGRLILALATGVFNLVPVAGAATVEYKNLYASALINDSLSELTEKIKDISKVLKEHENRIDFIVSMISDICQSLEHYLGNIAYATIEQIDPVADSLIRPSAPYAAPNQSKLDQLDVLLEEKQYELLLALLDEFPDLPIKRSRLLRTKSFYGLGRFRDIYALLKKESLQDLSQEELESFTWASFELGYIVDATKGLTCHEKMYGTTAANLFRISIKKKFSKNMAR